MIRKKKEEQNHFEYRYRLICRAEHRRMKKRTSMHINLNWIRRYVIHTHTYTCRNGSFSTWTVKGMAVIIESKIPTNFVWLSGIFFSLSFSLSFILFFFIHNNYTWIVWRSERISNSKYAYVNRSTSRCHSNAKRKRNITNVMRFISSFTNKWEAK